MFYLSTSPSAGFETMHPEEVKRAQLNDKNEGGEQSIVPCIWVVFKGIAARWCFTALSPSMRSGLDYLTSHDTIIPLKHNH
ncbi:hypothetical protein DPX16_15404 [Anabarilius grahami]|uniref:Uncharacterized protein n=1 Tax=Anabarilius grahami TaxID=495550 RepID=A0A3N0XVY5_ANAGA|nr:hypothetical protein DPX16_15404 [Anabarilius grahami]